MSRRMAGIPYSSWVALLIYICLSAGQAHTQSDRLSIADPGIGLRGTMPPLPIPVIPRAPQVTSAIGFPQVAQAAGVIFSGTVTSIARQPARHDRVETVRITFHVENAIRGVSPGDDLTIAQWIGLWSSGQRYRVGERLLLFLYPTSKLGLTSCVGATIGRFRVDPVGRVVLSAQQLSAFRADPVLGGKSRATFSDFALAVQQAGEEALTTGGAHEN